MANNEIIIRTNNTFKSSDLNNAVKSFDKFFSGINKNWRDACILMHRLADGKKYEADGFKSIAEFAETIGIEKSTAHKMADAGMVYDSKVPAIAQFADKAGYTKASKVASIVKDGKSEELAKAIDSGEISPDDSVNEIASWKATKTAQAKPEKVLPKYELDFIVFTDKGSNGFHYDAIEFENVPEFDGVVWGGVTSPDGDKVKIGLYPDGSLVRINSMDKVKKAPKAPKAKDSKDITKEELIALAESMGMKISF